MKTKSSKWLAGIVLLEFVVFVLGGIAAASTITISQVQHFRANSSQNTIGVKAGDNLVFGAQNVVPAGLLTTVVTATQGSTKETVPYTGGSEGIDDEVSPNQYLKIIPFNPALTDQWILKATNVSNSADFTTNTTPAPGANVPLIPFVTGMKISGTGTSPTISWSIPPGTIVNQAKIAIFDDEAPAVPRKTKIYVSAPFSPSQMDYVVPAGILKTGHRYVIRVQIELLYDSSFNSNWRSKDRSRSEVYLQFTPLTAEDPSSVYIPGGDGSKFCYDFEVAPGTTYFVQSPNANVYKYTTGAEDPNFASVVLPRVGDRLYNIYGPDGIFLAVAYAPEDFNFGLGGVKSFTLTGIGTANSTALITGLTFSGAGRFTGCLTPDRVGPTLAPVADKSVLWPANHKMVPVTIIAHASDNSVGPVILSASVTSNEPQDGLGDGDTPQDWTTPVINDGIITLQLRAERSGKGNGRIYTVTIVATDQSENSSTATVDIVVPHDKGK